MNYFKNRRPPPRLSIAGSATGLWFYDGSIIAVQRQTAVTAYLKSKQLLLLTFAVIRHCYIQVQVNIALRRFLHNHCNIATEGISPKSRLCPHSYRMTSRVLYSGQCHVQHCTLHTFEQFGALYMHNLDDKYPTRSGLELRSLTIIISDIH